MRFIWFCLICVLTVAARPAYGEPKPLLVFAAASQKDALEKIAQAFSKKTGQTVRLSVAASSTLARQISAGAPADIYISADTRWMDYLETRRAIQPASRRDIASNRLVLVAPAGGKAEVDLTKAASFETALGNGRLSMADPDHVPAGRYASTALKATGLWQVSKRRLIGADNVRVALALVAKGEVPLGIVYQSDAHIEPRVRVIATFPENAHPAIVYPAALTPAASPAARDLLAFLESPEAKAVFREHGFVVN